MSLDQSFSTENFRAILDMENRKGVFLEGEFFPKAERVINLIKKYNQEIRLLTKLGILPNRVEFMKRWVKRLKSVKERVLMASLEEVSRKVTERSFQIRLRPVSISGGDTIYLTDKCPENYFAMKQLQKNMYRLFQVKQSNRYSIISQLKILLEDKFPKYVVRTDISSFYESIPHEQAHALTQGNNLLCPLSKKLIRQVLSEYKRLTGNDIGIPRGIGISAYLAELYMRDFDELIREIPGVTYYARYVDDIVVVFTPLSNEPARDYRQEVQGKIEFMHLTMNPSKTIEVDLLSTSVSHQIEYLGYEIVFGGGKVSTRLSNKKVNKYRTRVDNAIAEYNSLSKIDEKKARSILVKRIRFLTGNTRLTNNKRNVLIGIYYSNSQLTDTSALVGLDLYLQTKIATEIHSASLQNRLMKYGFHQGYDTKRFSPFSTKDLSEIMRAWKPKVWP